MARWIEGEPQTTTRTPHTAHPRIEGTKVSPRVTGGQRRREFLVIDEEFSLLIKPTGEDFTVPAPEILESLANNAVLLRDATEKEKAGYDEREKAKGEIAPVFKNNPEMRGLISESRDVKLTATPTHHEIVFDISKLRKSARTRKRFSKLTSRRVVIEVTPRKDMDPDVLQTIIEEGLNSLGERVARRASVTTTWVVDDAVAAEMDSSGEITFLPGTRKVKEGLTLKAERLTKNIKNKKTS